MIIDAFNTPYDCGVEVHIISAHSEPGFNNNNTGLGIQCRNGQYILDVGEYNNSIGNHTNYAVVGEQPFNFGDLKFGAVIGTATGYNYDYVPVFAFAFTYKNINLTLVPEFHSQRLNTPWVAHLSYTFK